MPNGNVKPLAAVTGASSGIGYELARAFAAHGFDVIVAAEDAAIHDAAEMLRGLGVEAEAVQVDLASAAGVQRLLERIRAASRPLDALAINAGIGVGGPFLETDLEEEIRLIDLNITGAVRLAKGVLRDMAARGTGRVLITSSIAAEMPGPFEAIYAASKAFLLSFSEALNDELEGTGITVTALQPGPTDTKFFQRAHMEDTKVAQQPKDDPAEVARQGFEALMAGEDHVVAGSLKNKVQSTLAQVTPDSMKARVHRRLAEPGSGKK